MTRIETSKGNHAPQEIRTAKLFRNGRNQAVRLPREYELDAEEVLIRKEGNNLILTPRPRSWDEYFARASRLSDDFPDTIEELPLQEREAF
jgi:antitoxin VapB